MSQIRTPGRLKRVHFGDCPSSSKAQLPKSTLAQSTHLATHTCRNRSATVTTILKPFGSSALAKQVLHEIKLQKYLIHENLVSVADIQVSAHGDLIIMHEFMWNNLESLLSHGPLSQELARYYTYQTLRGLKYVHSSGFVYCDLHPNKIMLNENYDLKISIFGLNQLQETPSIYHVPTNIYSAPEVSRQICSSKADVWSTACILFEMLKTRPIVADTSSENQPCPIQDAFTNLSKEGFPTFVTNDERAFAHYSTGSENNVLNEFFKQTLARETWIRMNTDEALAHPYLAMYHDPLDEPRVEQAFDWCFAGLDLPKNIWKSLIFNEMVNFKTKTLAQAVPCVGASGVNKSGFGCGLGSFFEMAHP